MPKVVKKAEAKQTAKPAIVQTAEAKLPAVETETPKEGKIADLPYPWPVPAATQADNVSALETRPFNAPQVAIVPVTALPEEAAIKALLPENGPAAARLAVKAAPKMECPKTEPSPTDFGHKQFLFQTADDENPEEIKFNIHPTNFRDAVYSVDVIDHSKIS